MIEFNSVRTMRRPKASCVAHPNIDASIVRKTAVVLVLSLFGSGCESQRHRDAPVTLTGREIHEHQRSSEMEVARVVEVNGKRYFVPRASYVRLAEVGLGATSAHYQAWIDLKSVDNQDDVDEPLAATVTFGGGGRRSLASPDANWSRSDIEIAGLGMTTLWLDTHECSNDRAPPPRDNTPDLRIRAMWTVAATPLELSCRVSSTPTPSGKRPMACFGGSAAMPSRPTFGLYGGASLAQGCRSALESLASSFAHLPLIVADWESGSTDAAG